MIDRQTIKEFFHAQRDFDVIVIPKSKREKPFLEL